MPIEPNESTFLDDEFDAMLEGISVYKTLDGCYINAFDPAAVVYAIKGGNQVITCEVRRYRDRDILIRTGYYNEVFACAAAFGRF